LHGAMIDHIPTTTTTNAPNTKRRTPCFQHTILDMCDTIICCSL